MIRITAKEPKYVLKNDKDVIIITASGSTAEEARLNAHKLLREKLSEIKKMNMLFSPEEFDNIDCYPAAIKNNNKYECNMRFRKRENG